MRRRRFQGRMFGRAGIAAAQELSRAKPRPLCRREVGGGGGRISSATWPRGFTNFGGEPRKKPERSCETNTCPSQPAPEPIPIVGIASVLKIVSATSADQFPAAARTNRAASRRVHPAAAPPPARASCPFCR